MAKISALPKAIFTDTEIKLQRMKTFIKVIQELSLARDLKKIQAIVVSTARLLTGADGATFVLRNGNFCHYIDEEAIAPLWKGKRFPLKSCLSGWVMQNRKSVIIKDIYNDSRVPLDAYRSTFVKSLAMVPIRTTSPIGAIGNYWSVIHEPSMEDLELLQTLADTTAVALENVRVFDKLEEHMRKSTAELQAANETLERLSVQDELTGLYNRHGFYLLAEQELKRARRQESTPLIMFMDIDGLKSINDKLGHNMGDLLIAEAARVIKSSLRDSDIVGRLGGDEFCIMAVDGDNEAVRERMQKLINQFNSQSHPFKLSISVGAATPETRDEKLDSILARADQEMYEDKLIRKQEAQSNKTRH